MPTYEIPLIPSPQTFSIALAGITYNLSVAWNIPANCWVLDMANGAGVKILSGIPLVTGTDLLGQFQHLGFGGSLTVATDGDANAIPTYDNIGDESHLYFTVP